MKAAAWFGVRVWSAIRWIARAKIGGQAPRDQGVVAGRASSNDFERVIGCCHVSGLLCGSSTTAGRYGAKLTWCKISSTSSWLTDPDAFPDPLSPIFVLTVR